MEIRQLSPILQQVNEYTLSFFCPGCRMMHNVYLEHEKNKQAFWGWNGSVTEPTFSPSLLLSGVGRITDEERDILMAGGVITPRPFTCHFFIREGNLIYLGDCSHDHKNKTISMVDIPEDDK
jgi:hypothetical protein